MSDAVPDTAQGPSARTSIRNVVLGLLAALVVVAILGMTLREPLTAAGEMFVARFGVTGLFVSVFVMDTLPLSAHDPLLFAGITGGLSYFEVLFCGIVASILAGCANWVLGRLLGERLSVIRRMADKRGLPQLLERYGWWAMPIAGLLPVPFGLIAWAYAISGGPFAPLFLGTLSRAVKVVISVTVMTAGWKLGE